MLLQVGVSSKFHQILNINEEITMHFYILIPDQLLSYTNVHAMLCCISLPKP
jgi:hypothetical protein